MRIGAVARHNSLFFRQAATTDRIAERVIYNLDVVISVGYRAKSHRSTQFRIWATQRLRGYIVKGFALAACVGNGRFGKCGDRLEFSRT